MLGRNLVCAKQISRIKPGVDLPPHKECEHRYRCNDNASHFTLCQALLEFVSTDKAATGFFLSQGLPVAIDPDSVGAPDEAVGAGDSDVGAGDAIVEVPTVGTLGSAG